jgi:hypothetical protein
MENLKLTHSQIVFFGVRGTALESFLEIGTLLFLKKVVIYSISEASKSIVPSDLAQSLKFSALRSLVRTWFSELICLFSTHK